MESKLKHTEEMAVKFHSYNGKAKPMCLYTCLLAMLLLSGPCTGVEGVALSNQGSPSFTLHYTSIGERTEDGVFQMPGIYAGRLTPSGPSLEGSSINNTLDEVRGQEFACAQIGNTMQRGLKIKALSYDKSTHEVMITGYDQGRVNVLKGHLCRAQNTPCTGKAERSKLTCLLCKISPTAQGRLGAFVQWKQELYFVFIPDHTEHHTQLLHHKQLQLRKMTRCRKSLPIFEKFDVEACSTVIAMYNSISHHMQPASEMVVMDRGDKGHIFLTQARTYDWNDQTRSSYYQVGMILVGFHVHSNDKTPVRTHLFHDESLTVAYLDLPLANIGGIGVHMSVLCWSIFDRIQCGEMIDNGRTVEKKTVVLHAGEAAKVCKGQHQNITTGLAIASSRKMKEITLIFGCESMKPGEGGAGLLYMKAKKDGVMTTLDELKDSHGPVMAGSMFIAEEINCPTEGSPIDKDNHHGDEESGSSASACVSGTTMLMTFALMIGIKMLF